MKKQVSKILSFLPVSLIALISLSGCGGSNDDNKVVLRILNSADYIYEYNEKDYLAEEESRYFQYLEPMDMLDQFVEYMSTQGVDVTCVYDTYDTNETMYNEMMTGKSSYDVICTSDYMVQKLISNKLIQCLPTSGEDIEAIRENVSPFLWDIFDGISPKDPKTNEKMNDIKISQYSVPYMWGTVGIMYSPEYYESKKGYELDEVIDDFSSWDSLYQEKYKNTFSVKDSVRDTYAASIIHSFYDSKIVPLEIKLANGEITSEQFNKELNIIFNMCDDKTLKIVKDDMIKLRDNSFGFEVDSGKTDMVEGKVGANLAWSGDACWAIEEAESDYEKELYFSIPEEGSNIWVDAFCIPSTSKKADLATKFIEFMCEPKNAVQNMWSVGYTSSVASNETLDYIYECYDVREEIGGESEEEYVEYDLSYFFSDSIDDPSDAKLQAWPETIGRTLTAQFPEEDDLVHLCVMDDFGTQNKEVINMWEKVRTNPLPMWALIILIVEIALAIFLIVFFALRHSTKKKMIKARRKGRAKRI